MTEREGRIKKCLFAAHRILMESPTPTSGEVCRAIDRAIARIEQAMLEFEEEDAAESLKGVDHT